MIVLITCREINETTGREEIIVSHGMDHKTLRAVVLPCDPLKEFKDAVFSPVLGEYVLLDKGESLPVAQMA